MKSWRFSILLTVLLAGGVVVNAWVYLGEAHIERQALKDFPSRVAKWEQVGTDEQFDSETLAVLRASDYLLRNYKKPDGSLTNFYVGYYASQRDGATYHSPLNCLPGSGWVMNEGGTLTVKRQDGSSFKANRYVIQKGTERALVIYWYQGRGRSVANEYWDKMYTVLDSVARRRSDGALVRVIAPIESSTEDAEKLASDLASETTKELPAFVPN